jgi:uncharacterized membrane protein YphA (DoxX/SURF4 family)
MALTRRIARPLLASIFIVGGLDALRNPTGKAKKARAVTEPLRERVPATSDLDTETLIRINGGVQVVGGILLAVGTLRRVACLALMGSIVPTTYAGHRFWEETDDVARAQQRMHFVKNLGLLGGLILAAVDTEGEPSLGWRARRRWEALETGHFSKNEATGSLDLGSKSKAALAGVSAATGAAAKGTRRGTRQARRAGRRAGRRMKHTGSDVAQKAAQVGEGMRSAREAMAGTARESAGSVSHGVQQTGALVAGAARQLEPFAATVLHVGANRAGETLEKLGDRLG